MNLTGGVTMWAELVHSSQAWLLTGLGMVVVELIVPNGYALALAIAAAIVSIVVWGTKEYIWAAHGTQAMHWLWPVAAWAATSVAALWAIRRISNPANRGGRPDINEY